MPCDTKHYRQICDGGFTMLMGDLITLTQQKLPVKVVIFNNSVLGFVSLEQADFTATH